MPLLTLIFLIEVANAPKRDFPIWLDVVAVAVGFAILLGAWMLANRLRGRPLLARPVSVGVFEVAVFVLAPPAIPLLFGGQWRSALATAIGNLLLLVVIFLGTSYGVVPLTRWAGARTVRELEQVVSLLVRALPLLILFITFIFLQNEAWQITAGLHGPYYWIVLGLFVVIGVGFSVIRLPREIGQLSEFESWDVVLGRVDGTPASALVAESPRRVSASTRRRCPNGSGATSRSCSCSARPCRLSSSRRWSSCSCSCSVFSSSPSPSRVGSSTRNRMSWRASSSGDATS